MARPTDEQRAEWLRALEEEKARRVAKVKWEAGAGKRTWNQLIARLGEMGQRSLSGGEEVIQMLDELVAAGGDRERVDVIRIRENMSAAEAVSLVLMKDPEAAVRLMNEYARSHDG
jgi:hypothetical protein